MYVWNFSDIVEKDILRASYNRQLIIKIDIQNQ